MKSDAASINKNMHSAHLVVEDLKALEDELMNSFQVLWTRSSYKYIWISNSHTPSRFNKILTKWHKMAKTSKPQINDQHVF